MILELLLASALAPAGGHERPADMAAAPAMIQAAPAKSLDELWTRLGAAIDAGDMDAALALTKLVVDHPDFTRSPQRRQHAAMDLLGLLYAHAGQHVAALPYLAASSERPDASSDIWTTLIGSRAMADDLTGAVRALTTFIDSRPEELSELSDDFLLQIEASAEVDPEAAFELRLALSGAGWSNRHDSGLWLRLVDDLLRRGRLAEAVPVVGRVKGSSALLQMYSMRRYDSLREAAAMPDLDIEPLLAAELETQRVEAEAPGASVDARVAYASALHHRGRLEESLAVSDATLALPAPEAGSDDDRDLTWMMDNRARVLTDLGRIDEAVVQMQAASKRDEGGGVNVSQVINLGWFYLRAGDNARALAAVKTLEPGSASPYGIMQAMSVRACAAYLMGDEATAAPAFAHMEQNWRDAPLTWVETQGCRGDPDGAAETLLLILADEKLADAAVANMHTYAVNQHRTAYDTRIRQILAVAYARPDVVAARDRIARALTIPTTGSQF